MNWNKRDSDGYNHSPKSPKGPQYSIEDFLQDLFDKPQMLYSVILLLVIAAAIFTSIYRVRPQEKAVITRLGKFHSTSDEGLHFKLPFSIDTATLVPTKIQQEEFGFSGGRTRGSSLLSGASQNSNPFVRAKISSSARNFANESLMLTGDLNVADVEWVVQYKVKNPRNFLFNVADPVKNIQDLSQTTMRQVVGDLSINDILTTGRSEIESEVRTLMQKTIDDKYEMGVEIQAVILQDVAPPEPVQPSFNQVNSAIQEQKQEINRALEQQNKVIDPALGTANREISQARGFAEATINHSLGDASRFDSIFEEYKKAPEVTRRRLYLELTEQLMGTVKNFTVIDSGISGLLPIFGGNGGRSPFTPRQSSGRGEPRASYSAEKYYSENSTPPQNRSLSSKTTSGLKGAQ